MRVRSSPVRLQRPDADATGLEDIIDLIKSRGKPRLAVPDGAAQSNSTTAAR
jgi:hypothetical protein